MSIRRAYLNWRRSRRKQREHAARGFDKPHRLAVLGIMKDEGRNVDEWIAHYLWQGADHVFLIDNGSGDDSLERARKWEASSAVSTMVRQQPWRQTRHYWAAIRDYSIRRRFEWLLIADLDEFWFCPSGERLADALDSFESFDLLYVNGFIFGTCGHKAHPSGLREHLILRQPHGSRHIDTKWVCRTHVLGHRRCVNVHKVVGARSDRVISANDVFQLNHYSVQSLEFWEEVKLKRGDAASTAGDLRRRRIDLEKLDASCTVEDRLLADMVAEAEQTPIACDEIPEASCIT